ncbi:MAG: maleylacetate reductase [Proteobacteria bacterium]|nr:maleylacetate reductase [Pseudomonadota bacterium]
MSEVFAYNPVPVRVVFGYGALNSLRDEVERLSLSRPIIICSPGRIKVGQQLAHQISPINAHVCDAGLTAMPEEAYSRVMAEIESEKCDGIIAVGGGSPVGLLKAAAAHAHLPGIALVTSYSGSEMAANWYYRSGGEQIGGASQEALPKTVLYDPELTLSFPAALSAASGMNAMNHAVETLYSSETNPVVQDLSEEAIRRLGRSLPRIVDDPSDREARYDALYGAWHAAMFRAKLGLSHVMAQRCRSLFGLVHAQSHAVAVPYAVAFNRDAAPDAMRRIERALGVDDAARGLYDLNARLGLATGYKALGVPDDGLDKAVDIISGMDFSNPRPVSKDDLRGILGQAFGGAPPVN